MQSLTYRKKTSPFKTYRNDPARFFNDGVMFKAKLIGILEVGEARGDKMCQEALQDLKMAIRAAGEHKQRITIHVTIDGLRLRDEKTNDSLYHHPVHKISFIAQDMSDSRAFGYIFGSPDSGHRFFGIKTDKAASLVVLAMRDLFQVVFELKKKEIEVARQQINGVGQRSVAAPGDPATGATNASGGGGGSGQPLAKGSAAAAAAIEAAISAAANAASHTLAYGGQSGQRASEASTSKGYTSSSTKELSPESVADLVDLEQELSSIQRGITQMERITPNEPPLKTSSYTEGDPFGDSFTQFPTYNLLPPPESAKSRHSKPLRPPEEQSTVAAAAAVAGAAVSASNSPTNIVASVASGPSSAPHMAGNSGAAKSQATAAASASASSTKAPESWHQMRKSAQSPQNGGQQSTAAQRKVSAEAVEVVVQNVSATSSDENTGTTIKHLDSFNTLNSAASPVPGAGNNGTAAATNPNNASSTNQFRDAFTDLDPLGTGKSKPYIDKKYFFQDLKNPPKKVLRDLSEHESVFSANFAAGAAAAGADEINYLTDDDNLRQFEGPVAQLPAASSAGSGDYSAEITGVNFAPNFPEPEQQQQQQQQHRQSGSSPVIVATSSGAYYSAGNSTAVTATADPDSTIIGNNKALLVSDNDPFSPRMRKFDPFEDDFGKSGNDAFEFGFGGQGAAKAGTSTASDLPKIHIDKKITDFNGPLQVNLPPETLYGGGGKGGSSARFDRYSSMDGGAASERSRPGAHSGGSGGGAGPTSVFRQNTVDTMISSISGAKKMKPHLFSSQKYSRRGGGGGGGQGGSSAAGDSNTINMRRLQESDSMSENEGSAPEPPPRPTSGGGDSMHSAGYGGGTSMLDPPPPLPPKKQFSDIVIRPRVSSPTAANTDAFEDSFRYGYGTSARSSQDSYSQDSPALPLPSRKVSRAASSEASYPGPSRPVKKAQGAGQTSGGGANFGDDYLIPIGGAASGGDAPILLPPPQQRGSAKNRGRRQPEPVSPGASRRAHSPPPAVEKKSRAGLGDKLLPDITLSELLTLGIEDLAHKLSVPADKLSTMNIVELTQYLSEYVEKTSQKSLPLEVPAPPTSAAYARDKSRQSFKAPSSSAAAQSAAPEAAVFKVSFDADNEATFIAKFDDNFGEEEPPHSASQAATGNEASSSAVPNFANFNDPSASASSVDRYAVFREIIEQEMGSGAAAAAAAHAANDDEDNQNDSSFGSEEQNTDSNEEAAQIGAEVDRSTAAASRPPILHRIDTNITQVIAQAKDRYAALRDIIMVEDLFDKSAGQFQQTVSTEETSEAAAGADSDAAGGLVGLGGNATDDSDTNNQTNKQLDSSDNDNQKQSSPEINVCLESPRFDQPSAESKIGAGRPDSEQPLTSADSVRTTGATMDTLTTVSSKDDLEINEYMNRAISNLSLESRDHLSPSSPAAGGGGAKSPSAGSGLLSRDGSAMLLHSASATSPIRHTLLSVDGGGVRPTARSLSNASTSPIQLQQLSKSPMAARSPIEPPSTLAPATTMISVATSSRSPLPTQPMSASETPHKRSLNSAGSLSDVVLCPSSPDMDKNIDQAATSESWAVFESAEDAMDESKAKSKHDTKAKRAVADSAGSSDDQQRVDQRRWRRSSAEREYHKRWPRGHTSSSSRDLSPWDDEAPQLPPPPSASVAAADLRRRTGQARPPTMGGPNMPQHIGPDRHGFYMRHARRMPTGPDDEYDDYEDVQASLAMARRRVDSARRAAAAAVPSQAAQDMLRSELKFGDTDDGGDDSPPPVDSWNQQQQQQHGGRSGSGSAAGKPARFSWSPDDDDFDDDDDSEMRNGGGGGGGGCDRRLHLFDRASMQRTYQECPMPEITFLPPASKLPAKQGRRYYTIITPRHLHEHGEYECEYARAGAYERRERTATAPGGGGGGVRGPKLSKESIYDRERRSFDCESNDSSFDYGTSGTRRSYGSGDVYGSLDSRESEYRGRGAYAQGPGDERKTQQQQPHPQPQQQHEHQHHQHRSSRKPPKLTELMYQKYLQYSDGEVVVVSPAAAAAAAAASAAEGGAALPALAYVHRGALESMGHDTRSLQRPVSGRTRKSSGSSPWDGEELTPTSQKSWKRPGSAADSEKKLADPTDGDKDRRYRKKIRSRGKDLDGSRPFHGSGAATMRHTSAAAANHQRSADFGGYEPPEYDNDSQLGGSALSSSYRGSRRRLDSAMSMGSRAGTFERRSSGRSHHHQQQQQQQQEMHQHQHQHHEYEMEHHRNLDAMHKFSRSSRDMYALPDKDHFGAQFEQFVDDDSAGGQHEMAATAHQMEMQHHHHQMQQQQRGASSSMSRSESNRFSGYEDEQGFESDFNSPSNGGGGGVGSGGKSLRFSNDFSGGKDAQHQQQQPQQLSPRPGSIGAGAAAAAAVTATASASASMSSLSKLAGPPQPAASAGSPNISAHSIAGNERPGSADQRQTPTPKLRFDECVTVAQFDSKAAELFEDDDFSKAEFSFEAEDQWNAQLPKRTLKSVPSAAQQQRRQQQLQQENIRKSESVNIFAKKQDDPFEDDDFFKVSGGGDGGGGGGGPARPSNGGQQQQQQQFKWENDFAKFDENI